MRESEFAFILLAIATGIIAGLATVVIGAGARGLQVLLYRLPANVRLSGAPPLTWGQLAILPIGGLVLMLFNRAVRARRRALIDAVEANALHGGRLSTSDSLIIAGQTVLSNGFGASVGLEAAYAQLGALIASRTGLRLRLRRSDVRILVGAGAGAAIAAAFGAPLAGAFYAFEIVIGAYTPSAIAPVAAAALAGSQVAQRLGVVPYLLYAQPGPAIHTAGYLVYAGLGALCALFGIALMRAIALTESLTRAHIKGWLRTIVGGFLLAGIAFWSPQALSAGHSALHVDLAATVPLALIALAIVAKSLGSIVSLGFGFRGGLFFASLFLGTLIGHLYADLLNLAAGHPILNAGNAALVGMAALAVAVVSGPMTMAMLVLEATGNFSLTGAVLAASLLSSTMARVLFGYSFSTWRLHLRGETIKSARDVGWTKTLTAGKMMRRSPVTAPAASTVAELRRRFPLGATSRVVLIDDQQCYAGIVTLAKAYAEDTDGDRPVAHYADAAELHLSPDLDIQQIMTIFDQAQTDELAVLSPEGHVLGLLTDVFVRRRYAEELDKAQRDLFGER
ncbi:chloride channel protein [Sphingomonas sp. MMS24-J13]|uniref:chloride channel protein n=1 Tax=Sphingomonas sp. MMS24-J13 TaxID=3238686 RepID=UPI00385134EA